MSTNLRGVVFVWLREPECVTLVTYICYNVLQDSATGSAASSVSSKTSDDDDDGAVAAAAAAARGACGVCAAVCKSMCVE